MVSPELANFLFETVNFGLLAAALSWFLLKPVRRVLEREKRLHEDAEQRLREVTRASDEQTSKAKEMMQRAERDATTRKADALAALEREARATRADLELEVQARRAELRRELAAERRVELTRLAEAVGRVAGEAVRNLLMSIDGPALDRALIRRACRELPSLSDGEGAWVVDTARELDAEGRALLRTTLGHDFRERVQATLGAGVRVTTPLGQVDATALSIARQAASDVAALAKRSSTPEAEP